MTVNVSPIIMNIRTPSFGAGGFKYLALGVFASALLLANHAPAAELQRGQAQQVHRACALDMGLSPATAEYDVCVRSLLQSLADANEVASREKGRTAGTQEELKPETADFGH